ncbi:MAG: hypothetical protein UT21_C0006G0031 [Candidatus Woesebacteria bacterium GW2011_GWA1_39_11b]|nr:MAG: hypothetical protein UT21_C0006G0031 [Candidatus Woesebacteria bacterium GW2011_GWA1_39_11b]KKS77109.1 MAG: hypothetical protein UV51_C0010G0014 [Candidatus Woesebacteria bacterium GW2011_GWC1_42_9]
MKAIPSTSSLIQTLEASDSRNVLKIIYRAKLGGHCTLVREDWLFLADELKKDFKKMTLDELDKIIMRGIKGKLGGGDFINIRTFYLWIEENKKNPPFSFDSHPKNPYGI